MSARCPAANTLRRELWAVSKQHSAPKALADLLPGRNDGYILALEELCNHVRACPVCQREMAEDTGQAAKAEYPE